MYFFKVGLCWVMLLSSCLQWTHLIIHATANWLGLELMRKSGMSALSLWVYWMAKFAAWSNQEVRSGQVRSGQASPSNDWVVDEERFSRTPFSGRLHLKAERAVRIVLRSHHLATVDAFRGGPSYFRLSMQEHWKRSGFFLSHWLHPTAFLIPTNTRI